MNRSEMYFGTRTALELGFDLPWERWFTILVKYHIVALCINILRVDEETIHVEKASAHIRKTVN